MITHQQIDALAERAEEIYARKFKAALERDHKGQFVMIDVDTEEGFLGETPIEAMDRVQGRRAESLYLMLIGAKAAYSLANARG